MFRKPLNPSELGTITLKESGGIRGKGPLCIMQVVAWLAGERDTDRPKTTHERVAAIMRAVNDGAGDTERQRLLEIAPLLVNFHPSMAVMNAATKKLFGPVRSSAPFTLVNNVDRAINWVVLVHEMMRYPESFDDGMKHFIEEVEHGRITSAKKAMIASSGLGVVALSLLGAVAGLF